MESFELKYKLSRRVIEANTSSDKSNFGERAICFCTEDPRLVSVELESKLIASAIGCHQVSGSLPSLSLSRSQHKKSRTEEEDVSGGSGANGRHDTSNVVKDEGEGEDEEEEEEKLDTARHSASKQSLAECLLLRVSRLSHFSCERIKPTIGKKRDCCSSLG